MYSFATILLSLFCCRAKKPLSFDYSSILTSDARIQRDYIEQLVIGIQYKSILIINSLQCLCFQ
jgi:hypothetical protein